MAVECQAGPFRNPENGRSLFCRLWEPASCRGLIVIVHGFGEHGGRYEPFAQALAEHHVAVACPDLWGHGQSGGRRGDVKRFEDYLDDLDAILIRLLAAVNQPSCTVFGHSFGGLVAIRWVLRKPQAVRSLILQSPLLEFGFPIPRWKERLTRWFAPWWPSLPIPMGLNPDWLSHDPAIASRYAEDPLVHHAITLRCAAALQEAMRHAMDRATEVTTPTLLLYGMDDRVISIAACQRFAERLLCEKRVIGFSDSYHELHHEAVRPTLVEEVARWTHAHA